MFASNDEISGLLQRVMERVPGPATCDEPVKPARPHNPDEILDATLRKWRQAGICGKTLVTTNFGKVPAELIRVGDRVMVRSGRYLRVAEIRDFKLDAEFIDRHPEAAPVLIRQGSIGRNLPTQDVLFSPAQMIVSNRSASRPSSSCASELSQVRHKLDDGLGMVAYYEFQFDEPAEICCEGVWAVSSTEAFTR